MIFDPLWSLLPSKWGSKMHPSWYVEFQMAIYPQRVIRFTLCFVLGRVLGVGGSNGAVSGSIKFKMATGRHFGIFEWPYLRSGWSQSTSCLILEQGFRGRQIEWRYFRFDQIQEQPAAILENYSDIAPFPCHITAFLLKPKLRPYQLLILLFASFIQRKGVFELYWRSLRWLCW